MKYLLLFAVGIAIIASCLSLDCPDCDLSRCKDPGPCRFGKTLDVCACCPACYKGIGEECGGPWNVFGLCAHHLTCVKFPGEENVDPVREFNGSGKCLALPK